MKHQNKNSYDYYVKCMCIRFMIYTIANTWREHKIWVHINMGVSKTIHVCHKPNYHVIFHTNQNMLIMNRMKNM